MGCKGDDVEIYDSLQTTLNLESETAIARYLHSKSSHTVLKFVNIAMQCGSRVWPVRSCSHDSNGIWTRSCTVNV